MTTSDQMQSPVNRHPLRVGYFRNLLIGFALSQLGDQCFLVAMPWLVLQLSGSGQALGAILMVEAIPRAALMLLGGAVTDRLSPRRLLTLSFCVSAVLVGLIALLTWRNVLAVPEIYLFSFAFGVVDAFAWPATAALLPGVVNNEQLPAANSALQSATLLCALTGPVLAAFLIQRWGIAPVLALDAFSFTFAIAGVSRIQAAPSQSLPKDEESAIRSVIEGLTVVWRDLPLRAMCLLIAGMNLCTVGPLRVGMAFMAKSRFGTASALGLMFSVLALGSFLGTSLAGVWKSKLPRGAVLLATSAALGLGLVALGFPIAQWGIELILGAMGFVSGFINVQLISWIQGRVEPAKMGRVMSLVIFGSVGLGPVSYSISGSFGERHLAAMFVAAGVTMLMVTAVGSLGSAIFQMDQPTQQARPS
jgi:MFS family permease